MVKLSILLNVGRWLGPINLKRLHLLGHTILLVARYITNDWFRCVKNIIVYKLIVDFIVFTLLIAWIPIFHAQVNGDLFYIIFVEIETLTGKGFLRYHAYRLSFLMVHFHLNLILIWRLWRWGEHQWHLSDVPTTIVIWALHDGLVHLNFFSLWWLVAALHEHLVYALVLYTYYLFFERFQNAFVHLCLLFIQRIYLPLNFQ